MLNYERIAAYRYEAYLQDRLSCPLFMQEMTHYLQTNTLFGYLTDDDFT